MIKIFCNRCGEDITLINQIPSFGAIKVSNPFLIAEMYSANQYHLCNKCGLRAIAPITPKDAVNDLLNELNEQNKGN